MLRWSSRGPISSRVVCAQMSRTVILSAAKAGSNKGNSTREKWSLAFAPGRALPVARMAAARSWPKCLAPTLQIETL